MTHKAAREALELLSRNMVLDLADETIDAILSALDKHLIPDCAVTVCCSCGASPNRWHDCGGVNMANCPMRQGEKP